MMACGELYLLRERTFEDYEPMAVALWMWRRLNAFLMPVLL